MKAGVHLSRSQARAWLVSFVTSFSVALGAGLLIGSDMGPPGPPPAPPAESWHTTGNFRLLESISDDPGAFVQGRGHHLNQGGYGKLSSTRKESFNAFLNTRFGAIEGSLANRNDGDWCAVKSSASDAGYTVSRFFETVSGRWFIHGRDTSAFGQAYFFINPLAKRNIVSK